MKPTIVAKGVKLSRRLREYVVRRLSLTLDRKHYSIQAMKVRISDQNGPKGGVDKHCQIHLTLPGLPNVVVTEKGDDIAARSRTERIRPHDEALGQLLGVHVR